MPPQDRRPSVGFVLLGLVLVAILAGPANGAVWSHTSVASQTAAVLSTSPKLSKSATSSSGTAQPLAQVAISFAGPSAPAGLHAASTTRNSVSVAWQGARSFPIIYRVSVNGDRVGSTIGVSYTVTHLDCGVAYSIGVRAQDLFGARRR